MFIFTGKPASSLPSAANSSRSVRSPERCSKKNCYGSRGDEAYNRAGRTQISTVNAGSGFAIVSFSTFQATRLPIFAFTFDLFHYCCGACCSGCAWAWGAIMLVQAFGSNQLKLAFGAV